MKPKKVEAALAGPSDFAAFPLRASRAPRHGFVLRVGGRPVVLGSLIVHPSAGMVLCLDRVSGIDLPPITLHRFALAGLAAARARGVHTFRAIADKSIGGSESWLRRLGFVHIGDTVEGPVYECRAQAAY